MARPAKFTAEQILDAARDAAVEHWRGTTITHVTERIGAPTGSIYHRFPSRDALFGSLWARSIRRFHEGLLLAAQIEDPREAMAALTRHIPQFCRENPGDAKAMTLYRLSDLLPKIPAEQRAELATINDDVGTELRRVTARRYGRLTDRRYRLALLGTRQCPYGLVRPLIGGDIPPGIRHDLCSSERGDLGPGRLTRSSERPASTCPTQTCAPEVPLHPS